MSSGRCKNVRDRCEVPVVDDDDLQLRAVRRAGRAMRQLDLLFASSAVDAFKLIENEAHQIDLILMDVYMPEVDGVEACRWLKTNEKTAHIPVVLTSVAFTPELERLAYEAGALERFPSRST